jgi:hypothetical protein
MMSCIQTVRPIDATFHDVTDFFELADRLLLTGLPHAALGLSYGILKVLNLDCCAESGDPLHEPS